MTDGQGAEFLSDFESWTARVALEMLVGEALLDEEIVSALRREGLRSDQARNALLENETALARIRMEQDGLITWDSPRWRPSARETGWLAVLAAVGTGYLTLLTQSWSALPVPLRVFGLFGGVSVLLLSGRVLVHRIPDLPYRWETPQPGTLLPDERQAALGTRKQFVLNEIVLPELREYIRENRQLYHGTKLIYRNVDRLYSDDDDTIVHTPAARRLRRILERTGTGAIALAGHRGTGKTTMIRTMKLGRLDDRESTEPLVVEASAPAHYEARDFVLHLHAQLCHAVLDAVEKRIGEQRRTRATRIRRAIGATADLLALVFGGIAVSALLWQAPSGRFLADLGDLMARGFAQFPDSLPALWSGLPGARATAAGVLACCLALAVLAPVNAVLSARFRRRDSLHQLARDAMKQLGGIRYLQTFTSGWAGKVTLPFGGDVGRTRSTQRAEQQLTYPEVVDAFRTFAERAAKTLERRGTERVVIAIDELDKIGEPEKAQQFLNDVKEVFGIPGCLFFVSVSDEAVLVFEQRGLAARDALDSAFSEQLRLDPFTLDESRLWVALRVAEIPEAFCYLAHCLSGGLPRELKRLTIDMVDVTTTDYQPTLAAVTATLVHKELTTKASALAAMTAALGVDPRPSGLAGDLLVLSTVRDPGELAESADRLVREISEDDTSEEKKLRLHAGCFALFCATVLTLFDDRLTPERLTPGLHELAVAQRQMGLYPRAAWQRLQDFRKQQAVD
ncbi:P-loop NTPase fold protein [Amycolatopsis minnesotensis]|uniref:KAP NTPase domain-containing protein n=1 Tax=Amycolatopsis minnesotensis TaxID=337894 RepID=A0ABP5CGK3_9PSEU